MLSISQFELLKRIQNGLWYSADTLAKQVAMSPNAIWKNIQQLKEKNIAIQKDTKKGYRLVQPLWLLDEATIHSSLLPELIKTHPQWYILQSTPSTNSFCRQLSTSDCSWIICCAEEQTAGKGRLGRHWNSPFAQNIYCSIRWTAPCKIAQLSGLSLAVSLAIQQALSQYVDESSLGIKWPNDILLHGKKIAGILIEIVNATDAATQVVIGFGINVNSNTKQTPLSEHPHCSLFDSQLRIYNRNQILGQCLNQLFTVLQQFIDKGIEPILSQWRRHDVLYNQTIKLQQQDSFLQGIAKGINAKGELRLQTNTGILLINSGDASICKA